LAARPVPGWIFVPEFLRGQDALNLLRRAFDFVNASPTLPWPTRTQNQKAAGLRTLRPRLLLSATYFASTSLIPSEVSFLLALKIFAE